MPPRRKTTTSVRVGRRRARANATRVVTSWRAERGHADRAGAGDHPAPGEARAATGRCCSVSAGRTASACTRIAASARFGPCRSSSLAACAGRAGICGRCSVMASPQRVVDGVEHQRHQVLDLAAEASCP